MHGSPGNCAITVFAARFLIGWTATNLYTPESLQDGTYDMFFLSAFGLMPGQVPVSVKVKSSFFKTSASSMVFCMNRSSPQGPYFHCFLHASVSHLQHLPPLE